VPDSHLERLRLQARLASKSQSIRFRNSQQPIRVGK
jgi:hypothetical protein